MPLISCDFRKNQYSDSSTLLMETKKILHVLKKFFVPKKNGTENFYNKSVDWY
jgi:hypothetical protein